MLILLLSTTFSSFKNTIPDILPSTIQFKESSTLNTFNNYWIDYLDIFYYSFCQNDNFKGMKIVNITIHVNINNILGILYCSYWCILFDNLWWYIVNVFNYFLIYYLIIYYAYIFFKENYFNISV